MQGQWRRGRHNRRHRFEQGRRRKRLLMIAAAAVCAGVAIYSGVQLVSYAMDFVAAQRASQELREAYYAQEETPVPTQTMEPTPTMAPTATPAPTHTPEVSPTPQVVLEKKTYPNNELALTTSRFQKIRRQNEDIVGWLMIPELIDEAVVQRDNEYYLKRDYRGYHNVNGAIFMDESIKLKSRPYTIILYGHNMKTGAMFGNLRNYENISYYKHSPFVTFDSLYEDGRYVIFAAATVGTQHSDWNFIDFGKLNSTTIAWRNEEIRRLKGHSEFSCAIDVKADDQLLLLVTCVDKETERRVIAARRIRDNETEEQLRKQVQRSKKQ